MTYTVKEIFYSLQGEGANAGRAAVFCRFAGCNLWSGKEQDRYKAICKFCDTDFVGGKRYSAGELVDSIDGAWTDATAAEDNRFVILTGGEPALQVRDELLDGLHGAGFKVAIETNGTLALCAGIDWICVSPKSSTILTIDRGDELKLVYPQGDCGPKRFERLDFKNFFLQPKDGNDLERNTHRAIEYCKNNPKWRLSLQTHKMIGIR